MPDVPGRCFFAVGWPFSLSFWPGVAWLSSCCNPGVSCGILRCTASGLWWALGCCLRCCICLQACQNLRTLPILPRFWAPWGLCHRDPQGSTGNINLWFIEAMLSYQKVQVLVIAFYCFLACVCANLWLDMFFVLLVRAKGPENTATDANHVIFWILLMFMAGLLRTAGVILCVGTWHPAMTFLQGCSSQHLTMFSRGYTMLYGYTGLIVALRQLRRWCLKLRDQKRVRSCEFVMTLAFFFPKSWIKWGQPLFALAEGFSPTTLSQSRRNLTAMVTSRSFGLWRKKQDLSLSREATCFNLK